MHFCHEELLLLTSAAACAKPTYAYLKPKSSLLGVSLLAFINLGCSGGGTCTLPVQDAGPGTDVLRVPEDAFSTDATQADTSSSDDATVPMEDVDMTFTACPGLDANMLFTLDRTNCGNPLDMIATLRISGRPELIEGRCYADFLFANNPCGSFTLPWTTIVRGTPGYGVQDFEYRTCVGSTVNTYRCQLVTDGTTATLLCAYNSGHCTNSFTRVR